MSRTHSNWRLIAGTDDPEALALLGHCQRRGKVNPLPGVISDFLDAYQVEHDPGAPEHRPHLAGKENLFLCRLVEWRWGYKTCKEPLPPLSYWSKRLHIPLWYLGKMVLFLARQGLLRLWRGLKRNSGFCFSLDALHAKVAAWLEQQHQARKAADGWQEQAEVIAADEAAEEEEPERLPQAAYERAPEWQTIREEALQRTPKGARHWFDGVEGYRDGAAFVVCAPTTLKGYQLMHRFHDLLESLIVKYCRWCEVLRFDVAKASA